MIYKLQRVVGAKSDPRAPTCSRCQFSMENHTSQWFFGGPKLGKKSRTFQQISDTKSCGYVRNLVRFGVNVISFEGGGRWFSLFDRILVFGLNKESKAKFSPTFCHLQRKSSCHMEFLAIFSLAILSGK